MTSLRTFHGRTSRPGTSRPRLAAAAVTAVLAALSLSACNDGTGVHDEGPSSSTATTTKPPSGGSGADAGAGTGSGAGAPSDAAKGEQPASSGKPVTCEGSTTKTVAAPLTRPVNHMLLTVTNTGSTSCYLYGYPAVRFGEAQAVPPGIASSKPQAVVTLAPGESGYASVSLSATDGSSAHGHTVQSLTVHFRGRSGNESVGTAAHPALPDKGVYVDDSLEVTYWQQSMDDAVNW